MSGPESKQPDDALLDEFLAGQGAVRAVYRGSAREQAPAHLDAAILQAAAAAARQPPPPRRARWQTPIAAAAVLVLSFGVFLQVQRDPTAQQAVNAVSQPPAAPMAVAAEQDATLAAAMPEPSSVRERARAEDQHAPAKAATPAPKQSAESRQQMPKAPPPPAVMAEAPATSSRSSTAADEAVSSGSAASAGFAATASEPVLPLQRSDLAAAPMAKASRGPGNAAAFSAPAETRSEARTENAASADAAAVESAECAALKPGQTPAITTEAAAIAAARPQMIERFTAEVLSRYEPLQAVRRGPHWHVAGTLAAGKTGSVPAASVCASTGAVSLPLQP